MTAAITKSYRKALSIKPKSLKCFDSWYADDALQGADFPRGVHLDWMISLYFSSRHRDSHNEVLNKLFQHFVHNFKKAACDSTYLISLSALSHFRLYILTTITRLRFIRWHPSISFVACLLSRLIKPFTRYKGTLPLKCISHEHRSKRRRRDIYNSWTRSRKQKRIHIRSISGRRSNSSKYGLTLYLISFDQSLPPSPLERLKLSQLTVEEIATNYDVILNALWFCADREDARNPIFHRARQGGCSSSSKNMSLDVALSRLGMIHIYVLLIDTDALSKKEDPMTTCKNKLWLGNG